MYTVRAVEDAGPYKMIKETGSMNRSQRVEKVRPKLGFFSFSW